MEELEKRRNRQKQRINPRIAKPRAAGAGGIVLRKTAKKPRENIENSKNGGAPLSKSQEVGKEVKEKEKKSSKTNMEKIGKVERTTREELENRRNPKKQRINPNPSNPKAAGGGGIVVRKTSKKPRDNKENYKNGGAP